MRIETNRPALRFSIFVTAAYLVGFMAMGFARAETSKTIENYRLHMFDGPFRSLANRTIEFWNLSSPTPNPACPGRFHFKHPVCTPYIENLWVKMEGTPENLAILLKTINWQKFNEALTK